ncbi:ABC transporter ATP-binding protein [Lichenifustis flavocetrariae]|uniref:ABC transporter ATP-binding protein n=1 Tax=Lichenifustis flavocetrariae TaxID=2949735 RepID=A0AA41Z6N3_9HYPH|nr:ABC transporter ATP-binding protein [Lichenifustis flavocetrariae]MCW6511483.1 ABC transporter ATP-binding protein [Lichenifustis flavocetrariae]
MLVFDHVTKRFGANTAIDDVSLTIRPGVITAVIGPNGAGKSTLVNMAAGSFRTTSGRILLDDVALQDLPKYKIARAGLSRTYQNIRLFDGLTVLQNLEVALVPRSLPRLIMQAFGLSPGSSEAEARSDCETVLQRLGIAHLGERHAGSLAYGQQKLVELARAIVARPRAILLDEPAAGLNHGETDELKAHIQALRSPDLAIVLIEHDMKLIMSVSDEIYVMARGAVLAHGTPEAIRGNRQVQEAYLGQPGAMGTIEAAARGRRNRIRVRAGEGLAWGQP